MLENFDRVSQQNGGFPQEILFHCGDGWIEAARRRATAFNREIEPTRCGPVGGALCMPSHSISGAATSPLQPTRRIVCLGPTALFEARCTSRCAATSSPSLSSVLSTRSTRARAFRIGFAIRLRSCSTSLCTLSARGSEVPLLLAWLDDAAGSTNNVRLAGGGYGLQGIIDVAEGRPARDNVNALYNADTYAYFSMGESTRSTFLPAQPTILPKLPN
jgi:hypothetical protein